MDKVMDKVRKLANLNMLYEGGERLAILSFSNFLFYLN